MVEKSWLTSKPLQQNILSGVKEQIDRCIFPNPVVESESQSSMSFSVVGLWGRGEGGVYQDNKADQSTYN